MAVAGLCEQAASPSESARAARRRTSHPVGEHAAAQDHTRAREHDRVVFHLDAELTASGGALRGEELLSTELRGPVRSERTMSASRHRILVDPHPRGEVPRDEMW